MYKVIDLFAGAGGLSLGFEQTHKFEIKVAFENSPYMQETYRRNHPNVEVMGDVCTADYRDIKREYGDIDVVIGGPPCQGFSNANRQKSHAVNQNNMLVKQYLRAILELRPKAFVMENVGMLKSDVHRFYMESVDVDIVKQYNIPVKITSLTLLDEQYMFDGIKDILQNPQKAEEYIWEENDYFELNVIYKASKNIHKLEQSLEKHKRRLTKIIKKHLANQSVDYIPLESKKAFMVLNEFYLGNISASEIKDNIKPAIMFQRMLSKIQEIYNNHIVVESYSLDKGVSANIKSFAVFDYLKTILEKIDDGYVIDSDILCAADYGAPQKRMRFIVFGIKRSISTEIALPKGQFEKKEYRTVRKAIEDIEDVTPVYDLDEDINGIVLSEKTGLGMLAAALRDSRILRNHIVTRTTDTAMVRFKALKQGENFHSLDEDLKSNTYTDASRTQNTIYLRLNYDEPSGTVVNVRKSMWIHPTLDRAISVREAARLQTFPDSFIFYGTKDKQYQQVGNAVPPILAKAVAEKLAKILDDNLSRNEDDNR